MISSGQARRPSAGTRSPAPSPARARTARSKRKRQSPGRARRAPALCFRRHHGPRPGIEERHAGDALRVRRRIRHADAPPSSDPPGRRDGAPAPRAPLRDRPRSRPCGSVAARSSRWPRTPAGRARSRATPARATGRAAPTTPHGPRSRAREPPWARAPRPRARRRARYRPPPRASRVARVPQLAKARHRARR